MNKRMKNKKLKQRNFKRQEEILNKLKEVFNIESRVMGNGYFVFSMGENSVCHFTLKETPDWQYGIWLDKKKDFQIFGEHIELIDKFKPSRTYVSYENNVDSFIEEVNKIRDNPKLYFVDSLTNGNALVDYKQHGEGDDIWFIGYQAVRLYNEETERWDKFIRDESITQEEFVNKEYKEYYDKKAKRESDKEWDRLYAFNFFKELPGLFKEIIAIGVCDRNRKGWRCTPRYDLKIVVDNELSQDDFNELFDNIDDLIHNKNYSKERKTYEHQFSLHGCYDDLIDIKSCDYKFNK